MKEIQLLPIEKIVPNPYQPRVEFNQDSLMELCQSIRENGLIQPITVRENQGHYEIVAGERRYRACQLAGMVEIPSYEISANEAQMAELALVENIQRDNLSAIEEAKAYLQIMKISGCTQSDLANKMGRSQSSIANKIRLLNLDDNIQNAVSSKMISERHARALLGVNAEKQQEVLTQIIKKGLTVAQTEKMLQTEKKEKAKIKGFTRDIKIALNTVRQAVSMIQRTGISVNIEEVDSEDDYQMIIKFPKS